MLSSSLSKDLRTHTLLRSPYLRCIGGAWAPRRPGDTRGMSASFAAPGRSTRDADPAVYLSISLTPRLHYMAGFMPWPIGRHMAQGPGASSAIIPGNAKKDHSRDPRVKEVDELNVKVQTQDAASILSLAPGNIHDKNIVTPPKDASPKGQAVPIFRAHPLRLRPSGAGPGKILCTEYRKT